ncbi:CoA transferase [Nocardia vaccinii]|uniref:CoA transferase n=1 Tax=Nocardia vaccinii TaxID=1822 RepID=UPI000B031B7C
MTTTTASPTISHPLSGVRVLDLSALGPGPFASMVFASHGADVLWSGSGSARRS